MFTAVFGIANPHTRTHTHTQALFCPGSAANALIGWAIAQPILYAQLANIGFVSGRSVYVCVGVCEPILYAQFANIGFVSGRLVCHPVFVSLCLGVIRRLIKLRNRNLRDPVPNQILR